jgi:hypothetical protein
LFLFELYEIFDILGKRNFRPRTPSKSCIETRLLRIDFALIAFGFPILIVSSDGAHRPNNSTKIA